jgi:hypothetical protein
MCSGHAGLNKIVKKTSSEEFFSSAWCFHNRELCDYQVDRAHFFWNLSHAFYLRFVIKIDIEVVSHPDSEICPETTKFGVE